MKEIYQYIKSFWKLDFDSKVYGTAIIGLSIAIYFNFKFDFEDGILDKQRGHLLSLLYYFLYYAAAYYYVIFLYWIFKKEVPGLKDKLFWSTSMFILFLLSFKVYFHFYEHFLPDGLTSIERYAFRKWLLAFVGVVIFFVGIAGFYLFFDKEKSSWYGMTTKGFKWQPYAIMLLIMIPLIGLAATQEDFLKVYPRLKIEYFKSDYYYYFLRYEPFYLLGFVMLEWLLRGMMVIGLVRFLGHRAVLPMAVMYCVIHFGKPLGECVSSFFGGYLLGIFAYYSRSIWGGIMIHMGIAFLMDIAALIAYHINNS